MINTTLHNSQQQLFQVSAKEFAAKYKSKKECYDFLTVTAGAYLCDKENLTIYFLKDVIAGKKRSKN